MVYDMSYAQNFWEDKILRWENDRYQQSTSSSLLENLATRASNSLRFRQELAIKLLAPIVKGKSVIEYGCGSALMSETLIKLGARDYTGYDIASNAIMNAISRVKKAGIEKQVKPRQGNVLDVAKAEGDIVFSLGLIDWLSPQETKHLYYLSAGRMALHAISERRQSFAQYCHRLYVYVAYGWKSRGYAPQYSSTPEMRALALTQGLELPHVVRDPQLSFSTFLVNLGNELKIRHPELDINDV